MNSEFSFALCLVFILLVPFAIAGLSLINVGLGRSRSAAHFMTSSLTVLGVAVLVYFVWGCAVQKLPFGDLVLKRATFLGFRGPGLLIRDIFINWDFQLAFLLGACGVGLASLIPLGAAADRWRFSSAIWSTVLLAGCIFPIFGRLALFWFQINVPALLPAKFLDNGSGLINVTGGLTALSIAWLLGPRHGKYSSNGMPAAIPAHNAVFVLFGCMLAWVGWMGLNAAGAMLYAGARPEQSVLVVLNTTLSAAAAALTAAAVTRIRYHRPDASLIANGWMAGLVASSAGCAAFKPPIAVLVGLVAGGLVVFSVEFFELSMKVDDPCGSVSVHAVCGLWGLLAVGIFSGSGGQFMAQLVGVATLLGFIFPMTYGLNWLLNRFIPYRVSPDGERQGLDLHELGADAYPEFVVHSDEFMQR